MYSTSLLQWLYMGYKRRCLEITAVVEADFIVSVYVLIFLGFVQVSHHMSHHHQREISQNEFHLWYGNARIHWTLCTSFCWSVAISMEDPGGITAENESPPRISRNMWNFQQKLCGSFMEYEITLSEVSYAEKCYVLNIPPPPLLPLHHRHHIMEKMENFHYHLYSRGATIHSCHADYFTNHKTTLFSPQHAFAWRKQRYA